MLYKSGLDIMLHDHMDGSIAMLSILEDLYKMAKLPFPFPNFKNYHDLQNQITNFMTNVHKDIVERFAMLTKVLQTKDALFLLGETYVKVRANQGFRYCEARIAPQYHIFGGLTVGEAIDAIVEGIKSGEHLYPHMEVDLIPSVGREVSSSEAVRLIREFNKADREYTPGIDLVCNEAKNKPHKHLEMYREATRLEYKKDCHVAEWVVDREPEEQDSLEKIAKNFNNDFNDLVENINFALFELEVDRFGHGIPVGYLFSRHASSSLCQTILEYEIGIEGCPGSNLKSSLIPNVSVLHIREMLKQGVLYSINPDDDLFLPNLPDTFDMCDKEYQFSPREKEQLRANAWATRFGNRKPVPRDVVLP
ncbi:hypothetical protein KW791_01835 [Candidatus Parcubacteria bacterium]|nr:hypothetical protein [Candidatus Parcubacteria bacterium]